MDSVRSEDLIFLFTRPLEDAGLEYFVTGSVAAIAYGEPRMTRDLDLVLELPWRRVDVLTAAFPPDKFYCPPEEVMVEEARRDSRGHINLIHHATGFKADLYLRGQDPLHAWAMARRRRLSLPEGRLWVAPPEYVIVRKLEFYREGRSEKHLRDIRAMADMVRVLVEAP